MANRNWEILIQQVITMIEQGICRDKIAAKLQIKPQYLSIIVNQYRDKGYKIPDMRSKPQGSILYRTVRGTVYVYMKQGDRWVSQGRKDGPVPGKKRGPKPIEGPRPLTKRQQESIQKRKAREIAKAAQLEELRRKAAEKVRKPLKEPKKAEYRLPDRKVDQTTMKYVKINSRISVQVPIDADPEEVIRKYNEKMANRQPVMPGMQPKTYR
jgi:hypothetical protein